MTYMAMVSASACFSDAMTTQKASTCWAGHLIKTTTPDLDTLEDIMDIFTAVQAEVLYHEQGRSAFVPFEELKRDKE